MFNGKALSGRKTRAGWEYLAFNHIGTILGADVQI